MLRIAPALFVSTTLALSITSSCGSTRDAAGSAPVTPRASVGGPVFEVYREEQVGTGLRVYVELPQAVSESELQRTTAAVAAEYPLRAHDMQVVYSLDGDHRPAIWGTARCTPDPTVEVLALTPAFLRAVDKEFAKAELVGRWMQYGADGGMWLLEREELGGMKMHWRAKSGETGVVSVSQKNVAGSVQFCDLAGTGDCFTVTRRGDLTFANGDAEGTHLYRMN